MVSISTWSLVEASSFVHQSRWRQLPGVQVAMGRVAATWGGSRGMATIPSSELWRRVGGRDSPWGAASPAVGISSLKPLCLHLFSAHEKELNSPSTALVTKA